jgi:hypothetical protein
MRTTLAAAAAAAFALAGCASGGARSGLATTYGPMHLFGGYSDKQIAPDVWQVTGAGNGPAGEGFGRNVAAYRAAEIVKAHGFTHLQILDQHGKGHRIGVRGGSMSFAGERMTLTVRGTNDPSAPLACRAKLPRACMTLRSDTVLAALGPSLAFRKGRAPQ